MHDDGCTLDGTGPIELTANRRDVLRLALCGAGALVLSAVFRPVSAALVTGSRVSTSERVPITAWVRVDADGSVTLVASQSEMGQGITTTLAAALADELYLSWQSVKIEFGPFDPAYRDPVYQWMFTGNSQSTSSFYEIMRKMGAAAREMLTLAAATRLGVTAASLSLRQGVIWHDASRRSVMFGEVAADAARLPVPANPTPREHPQLAGRSIPRWDILAKVDGSAIFGVDVKLPGMLCAAVRCAPRFGARLINYDRAAIRAGAGVLATVEVPNGLAVVAKTYWEARRALDSAVLGWSDEGSSLDALHTLPSVYAERLASGPFFAHKVTGDAARAMTSANRSMGLYQVPFQAHGTLEPMNCSAHITGGRCDIWAPTQGVEMAQNVAMQVTGLPSERITIHRTMIGGGFGRRLLADFIKQTLIVAMTVQKPVKLIWSREEDMTHDFYRPAMLHKIEGATDSTGTLIALAHRVVSPSHMLYIFPRALFPDTKDWTDAAAPPEKMDTMAVEGLLEVPYEIANQRVDLHRLELDIPVSVWRSTGHGPNNFVLESFIDELAFAAGAEPLAFRRRSLGKNVRALRVLELLEQKSDWQKPLPAGSGRGMGLASAFGGLVAAVAELSVINSDVKVQRVTAVVDCGRTLDPGIATSNILGGIVWGLSGMRTAMTFKNGCAQKSNFDGFEPLHLWETPACEVHFIESGAALGGTGELGAVPVHAAVCNAIFAATRQRIRALPLELSGFSFV